MGTERKDARVCIRLPAPLVARVDYVTRNTDNPGTQNRSTAVHAAIEAWLPGEETRLERLLGTAGKKTR